MPARELWTCPGISPTARNRDGEECAAGSHRAERARRKGSREGPTVRLLPTNVDSTPGPLDEQVIPDLHSRVTIIDKNDKLITHLGDNEGGWKIQGWPNIAPTEIKTGLFSSPRSARVRSVSSGIEFHTNSASRMASAWPSS